VSLSVLHVDVAPDRNKQVRPSFGGGGISCRTKRLRTRRGCRGALRAHGPPARMAAASGLELRNVTS
jgi:hypothetical protein